MSDRILGLAGVIIWTHAARFEAMRRFYRDVLGLTPHSDRAQLINFQRGAPPHDVRLTISVHDAVEATTREPERIMLHLAVNDIHAAAARLIEAGVSFSRPPEEEPWGGWVATFHDPDGNTVQLLQPATAAR